MKREILFRGKRVDNGRWTEGLLYDSFAGKRFIRCRENWEGDEFFNSYYVDFETVSQFIGLTDKNGVNIFEGDILKQDKEDKHMVVGWNNHFSSFCIDREGWMYSHYFGEALNPINIEVIGNIYDNPNLLSHD